MRAFLVAILLLITACAPRAELLIYPDVARSHAPTRIFISTTRGEKDGFPVSAERDEAPSYHFMDISVPENRVPGSLSWPRRDRPVDPATQFVTNEFGGFASRAHFTKAMRSALQSMPKGRREATIYIHGFNNTFAEGALRIAQLNSDFKYQGLTVHYAWPSAANPLGYEYDRESQLFGRDGLEDLIESVIAAGPENIIIVGHSMGAMMVMETMRQMAIANPGRVAKVIDGVILISPDIDVDLFRMQAGRIGKLPRNFNIVISERDRALRLSALLSGQRHRLGNIGEVERIADLDVTVLNVTAFKDGGDHFVLGNSPSLIALLNNAPAISAAFERDGAGRTGLLPGVVLTVQNATELILSPVAAIR